MKKAGRLTPRVCRIRRPVIGAPGRRTEQNPDRRVCFPAPTKPTAPARRFPAGIRPAAHESPPAFRHRPLRHRPRRHRLHRSDRRGTCRRRVVATARRRRSFRHDAGRQKRRPRPGVGKPGNVAQRYRPHAVHEGVLRKLRSRSGIQELAGDQRRHHPLLPGRREPGARLRRSADRRRHRSQVERRSQNALRRLLRT